MTTVESAQKADTAGSPPASTGGEPAKPSPSQEQDAGTAPPDPGPGSIIAGIGIGITLLAVLVLGFAGYLYYLSGVQEARTQTIMYARLSGELQQAVAPLGATAPGSPVAILNIPAIGLHNEVVVEGTSPQNLTNGPGHLRDTPLPGQAGIAVLYGKRATFGAPFARIPQLRPGDTITVTTGQGRATYRVKLVGDSRGRILINPAPNQLLLLTADSAWLPSHYIEVSADLTSAPQQDPGGRPAVGSAETALGNDPTTLILTMAWGLALVIVSVAGTIAAARWSRWPAYLATVPIALAVVWNFYQSIAALLPNIY